jgi:hypothetical protein
MAERAIFKRGQTITINGVRSINGSPVNLTGFTLACMIKKGRHSHTLAAGLVDPIAGTFVITSPSSQSRNFDPGNYDCDVKFMVNNVVAFSMTFTIVIERNITDV